MSRGRDTESAFAALLKSGPFWTRAGVHIWPFAGLLSLAAILYLAGIGYSSLGPSEAWSLVVANALDVSGTIKAALAFDPGKPPLYHLMLHFVCSSFGTSEIVARALSAILGIFSVAALYLFGTSILGEEAGALGATLWALCPVAFLFARWARMYSAFVALVIIAMWMLWTAREKASFVRLAGLALSAAAMLYVHMSAVFYLGAALLMCARDLRIGRVTSWRIIAALVCGVLLFAPFLGIEIQQAHDLLLGHWLDWSGARSAVNAWGIAAGLTLAVTAITMTVLAPGSEGRALEPLRFCLVWCTVPAAALIAISLAARPVMQLRYVAPSLPPLMLLAAFVLQSMRRTPSHVLVGTLVGIFTAGLIVVERTPSNTWREIASQVGSSPAHPVFFERGFVVLDDGASSRDNSAFPEGYYRAPFDYYYYKASTPRFTIDPQNPAVASHRIAAAAQSSLGAWLVSGKSGSSMPPELPNGDQWQVDRYPFEARVTLWHVEPRPFASISSPHDTFGH